MGTNTAESGGREERKEMDSTPQETDVMKRYIDLQANAYDAFMSDEERKDFAQNLIDVVKLLNEGKGMSSAFCEDLLNQVQGIEEGYLRLQRASEAVKQLERESRGDVLVPHLYEKAVKFLQSASNAGVPVRALQPLEKIIREYLVRVRSQSGR